MDRPECAKCGAVSGESDVFTRVASISGSVMGDEYTSSFFYCAKCELYTIGQYHDHFGGEDTASFTGGVSKADAEPKIAIIRRCEEPTHKRCRCEAHIEYFGNSLD